ncbi:MAG: hypothetical protein ACTSU2_03115 [Promethearchaeota archaeon]
MMLNLIDSLFSNSLNNIFCFFRAIGSLVGVLLIAYVIIRFIFYLTFNVKMCGPGKIIIGIVLVIIFGGTYGFKYFGIAI